MECCIGAFFGFDPVEMTSGKFRHPRAAWNCIRAANTMTNLGLPLSQKIENDRICDDFESAWERHPQQNDGDDHRPKLEDYLGQISGSQRSLLFRDLLALELVCRTRRGEDQSRE